MKHLKRWAAVAAALSASVLGGCAMQHHDRAGHLSERLYQRPLVTLKAGILSVSPEPLVLRRSEATTDIVWSLPPGLSFGKAGIAIEGLLLGRDDQPLPPRQDAHLAEGSKPDPSTRDHFRCAPRSEREFACTVDKKAARVGIYKYTIHVRQGGKDLPPADPNIFHLD